MKKIGLLFLILILSSCAVSYNSPLNRFETPETEGGYGKFKLAIGGGVGNDVQFTPDFSQVAVNTQTPLIKRDESVYLGAGMGVLKRLDLGLTYVGDYGLALKAKWQFVGEKLKPGLQLALSTHLGGGGEDKSETNSTYTRVNLDTDFLGGDFIVGYRCNKSILIYTSYYYDDVSYDLEQVRGTTTSTIKGGSTTRGATLGGTYHFTEKLEGIIEVARGKTQSRESKLTSNAIGGVFVIHL